jgi:hypothetical protein
MRWQKKPASRPPQTRACGRVDKSRPLAKALLGLRVAPLLKEPQLIQAWFLSKS